MTEASVPALTHHVSCSTRSPGLTSAGPSHVRDVLSPGWMVHSAGPAQAEFTLWEEARGGHSDVLGAA